MATPLIVSVTGRSSVAGGAGEKRCIWGAAATGVGVTGAGAGGRVWTAQERAKAANRVIANRRIGSKLLDSVLYDISRNSGMQAAEQRVEHATRRRLAYLELTVRAARVE